MHLLTKTTPKVPAPLESILGDPQLFSNSGEITSKELLKRFQELQGQGQPLHGVDMAESITSRQDGSTRPPARRVETDPALWRGESSVRPVIQDTTPVVTPGPAASAIVPPPPPTAPAAAKPPIPTYQAYNPYRASTISGEDTSPPRPMLNSAT